MSRTDLESIISRNELSRFLIRTFKQYQDTMVDSYTLTLDSMVYRIRYGVIVDSPNPDYPMYLVKVIIDGNEIELDFDYEDIDDTAQRILDYISERTSNKVN